MLTGERKERDHANGNCHKKQSTNTKTKQTNKQNSTYHEQALFSPLVSALSRTLRILDKYFPQKVIIFKNFHELHDFFLFVFF